MVWARDFNQTGNSAGFVVDLLAGIRNQLGVLGNLGWTITRIVGTHDIRVVSTDDAFTRWEWGLVTSPIFRVPAVTHNPLTQPGDDWLFARQEAVVQVNEPDPGAGPDVKSRSAHYDMDIHSQRKLSELEDTLWYVGDNPDGDNFDVNFQFNVLIKLP